MLVTAPVGATIVIPATNVPAAVVPAAVVPAFLRVRETSPIGEIESGPPPKQEATLGTFHTDLLVKIGDRQVLEFDISRHNAPLKLEITKQ